MNKTLGILILGAVVIGGFYVLKGPKSTSKSPKQTVVSSNVSKETKKSKTLERIPESFKKGFRNSLSRIPENKRVALIERIKARPMFQDNPHLLIELQEMISSLPPYKEQIDLNKPIKAPKEIIEDIGQRLRKVQRNKQQETLSRMKASDPRFKQFPDLEEGLKIYLAKPIPKQDRPVSKDADEETVARFKSQVNQYPPSQKKQAIMDLKRRYPHYFKKWPNLEKQIQGDR